MTLSDHKNAKIKLMICAIMGCFFAVLAIKHGPGKAQYNVSDVKTNSSTKASSKAYFNPVTGEFTSQNTNPDTQIGQKSSRSLTALKSGSFKADAQTASSTNSTTESSVEETYQQFNNSFVIPMPQSMRTQLVATRSADGQTLRLHHDTPESAHNHDSNYGRSQE